MRTLIQRSRPDDNDLKVAGSPVCYYCGTLMTNVPEQGGADYDNGDEVTTREQRRLFECAECGWWAFHGYFDRQAWGGDGAQASYAIRERIVCGVAKMYDLTKESLPVTLVRKWLTLHPNHLAHVNPYAFERLIADCFKDVYCDAEVVHLGSHSGDGGVDIKLVMSNADSILVQVKRRKDLTTSEGVETIRSLNGALLHQGVARGIVVTTARTFTTDAQNESRPSQEPFDRYRVDLLAFDDVVSMLKIGKKSAERAWQASVEQFAVSAPPSSVWHPKEIDIVDVPDDICGTWMRGWAMRRPG